MTKAEGVEDMGWFARLLHETLNTEMSLHVGFCGEFGITEEELKSTEPSPTTLAYTGHLVRTAFSGTVGEIVASILPCSWGYCEIGQMLSDRGAPPGQPLYARWNRHVQRARVRRAGRVASVALGPQALSCGPMERGEMEEAFLVSSRYEYMFWDAAYRMEQWPV